jgi:RNA polymerase primary sigma factor
MRQLKITKSVTNRDIASLDKYLQEIGKVSLITAEEEVELAQRIRQGDREAFEKLTKANLRFVVSVAKQYQNQGLSRPDLINEGNLGLMKAARRFDETRGFKFISYAVWWIRQSILQALAEQSRIVRLPLNKFGAINKIKKAYAILEQRFEREPSSEEISEFLEIKIEEYEGLSKHNLGRHVSMDMPMVGDEDNCLIDIFVGDDAVVTDSHLLNESLSKDIDLCLNTLSQKEKEIISLYYGIGVPHGLTLEEIAKKFDLTRERVRQIKEKGIRRLKQKARSKLLVKYL